jgi:hypothetical protein
MEKERISPRLSVDDDFYANKVAASADAAKRTQPPRLSTPHQATQQLPQLPQPQRQPQKELAEKQQREEKQQQEERPPQPLPLQRHEEVEENQQQEELSPPPPPPPPPPLPPPLQLPLQLQLQHLLPQQQGEVEEKQQHEEGWQMGDLVGQQQESFIEDTLQREPRKTSPPRRTCQMRLTENPAPITAETRPVASTNNTRCPVPMVRKTPRRRPTAALLYAIVSVGLTGSAAAASPIVSYGGSTPLHRSLQGLPGDYNQNSTSLDPPEICRRLYDPRYPDYQPAWADAFCQSPDGLLLCANQCDMLSPPPPPPPQWECEELVRIAEECDAWLLRLCPVQCADARNETLSAETLALSAETSCEVLITLDGGCAYDLTAQDPERHPPYTDGDHKRVADVCPDLCSGHQRSCKSSGNTERALQSALDISFLGNRADSTLYDNEAFLGNTACIDNGGVQLDGEGWVSVVLGAGNEYGNQDYFSLAFWMLPAEEDMRMPHSPNVLYERALYVHPPQRVHHPLGGIHISLNRGAWLDEWVLRTAIAGTVSTYRLDLLRDATPKWTHLAVVISPWNIKVFENGVAVRDTDGNNATVRQRTGRMELTRNASIGGDFRQPTHGWPPGAYGFRGSIAMLQVYEEALSDDDVTCVFGDGTSLVHHGRMDQSVDNSCVGKGSRTGCTSAFARNPDLAFGDLASNFVDDGSCEFPNVEERTAAGEHASLEINQEWQHVELQGNYRNPIVLCGVVTRQSTTETVVRINDVQIAAGTGKWGFWIMAEHKSCHITRPPRSTERVSYLVVEAGVSAQGWNAGKIRVHDTNWHRVSYLREMLLGAQPIILTQVQTGDARTKFVSTRHFFPERESDISNFVHVDLDMTWPDAREYCQIHYHDLASIHSAYENELVVLECRKNKNQRMSDAGHHWCYIGLNDMETEDSFVWSDDTVVDYTNWWQGQPNNAGGRPGADGQDWVQISDRKGVSQNTGGELPAIGLWNDIGRRADTTDVGDSVVAAEAWTDAAASGFVCERRAPGITTAATSQAQQRNLGFFIQVQGEGTWCPDNEFYAEYFDSVDLQGNPLATQCEVDAPAWHWHVTSSVSGVPPPLIAKTRALNDPTLFSARWTTRINVVTGSTFAPTEFWLSSYANQGSRIIVDDATVLDRWDTCCSIFTTQSVPMSPGYHTIVYEYQSGYSTSDVPTNSFAELSWRDSNGTEVGSISGSNYIDPLGAVAVSNVELDDELFADVGWIAFCTDTTQLWDGAGFLAGKVQGALDLVTNISFASTFRGEPPLFFGSTISQEKLTSHLRLGQISEDGALIITEYDTCSQVFIPVQDSLAWLALEGDGIRVNRTHTSPNDTEALLHIAEQLQLPDYFHWRENSDPCRDRWTGIECVMDESAMLLRVVVLDIHSVDLTNLEVPWEYVGRLTALQEMSMRDCGLKGAITAASLCELTQLQVLVLRRNELYGIIPECVRTLPLEYLWLDDNSFHGPLLELSDLGQFLKQITSLHLELNHWTPLLPSEKLTLRHINEPLGVSSLERQPATSGLIDGAAREYGLWDFEYRYDWEHVSANEAERLTARREESYRQWSAGTPFDRFSVNFPFDFPVHGALQSSVSIGSDGLFALKPPVIQLSAMGNYISGHGDTLKWTASIPDDGSLEFTTSPADHLESVGPEVFFPVSTDATPPVRQDVWGEFPPGLLYRPGSETNIGTDALYGQSRVAIGVANTLMILVTPIDGSLELTHHMQPALEADDIGAYPYLLRRLALQNCLVPLHLPVLL